jgi:hypothetical protein
MILESKLAAQNKTMKRKMGQRIPTLIIAKTAWFQLDLRDLRRLLGFRSHIKSTPHMFPL